jgi:hypothetical protein
MFTIKKSAGRRFFFLDAALNAIGPLFGEIGRDKSRQRVDGGVFIFAVGDNADLCTLYNAKRKNPKETLGVNSALFLLNPDAASELVRPLDEKGRWSGMETYLIVDNRFFDDHARHSLNIINL